MHILNSFLFNKIKLLCYANEMEHTHIENVKNFSTENSRVLTYDYVNKLNAIYCMQIILNEIKPLRFHGRHAVIFNNKTIT